MKYQSKNSAILLLLILFSCQEGKQKKDQQKESIYEEKSEITVIEDSLSSLFNYSDEDLAQMADTKNNITSGSPFISRSEANRRIKMYKWHKADLLRNLKVPIDYDAKKDIYGFTFDLNNMKSFMKKIEDYNKNPKLTAGDSIYGIRVYSSYRRTPSGLIIPEVFLVPTLKSKYNLYDEIDDDYNSTTQELIETLNHYKETDNILPPTDDIILDSSNPCPNNCSGS